MPNRPMPPAAEAAHRLLAEHGPLPATGLRERLRLEGFAQPLERLQQWPDRFPHRFDVTADGLLRVAIGGGRDTDNEVDPPTDPGGDWYRAQSGRVQLDRVAVLDIETTGLNRSTDVVTEIALVRLDGTPLLNVEVAGPADPAPESALRFADALSALRRHLHDVDLLVGHNLLSFDLPFLKKAAEREGLDCPQFPDSTDSLHLSLLVDVALPNRQLADLTLLYGLTNEAPHSAYEDATATAAVVRAMLSKVDVTEPSWQLAIAILETHRNPLTALLPSLPSPPDLTLLHREPDPLLHPSGPKASDAWSGTRDTFPQLRERRNLHPRPAQQEMAHAVAEVFDRGGNLAVEAPTGTGKSLAYLLPALARASRPRQPVVIATATKALQGQLRAEAARLQQEGLLGAPFRQMQGVANYVCARELEDTVNDRDASGLTLAVAFRAVTQSPNGTWDDVTDDILRRADTRYARTRARLRTNAAGCDRASCTWAHICPVVQQSEGLTTTPGVVSVNHALMAAWVTATQAPGDILTDKRADVVFDEAHTLEDSLTAAWTGRVDAIDLEILVNSLRPRSRMMRDIQARAGGEPATKQAIDSVATSSNAIRSAGAEFTNAITTYLHEYGGKSQTAVLRSGIVDPRPEFRVLRQSASTLRYALLQLSKAVAALSQSLREISGLTSARRRLAGHSDRIENAVDLLSTLGSLPDSHLWVYRLAAEEDDPDAGSTSGYLSMCSPSFSNTSSTSTHSTVLCSATLTVEQRFDFLASRLGIRIEAATRWDAFRACYYTHRSTTQPSRKSCLPTIYRFPSRSNEREFCEDMAADQVGFLSLSGGKTLALFAARSRMEVIADGVRAKEAELAERGVQLLVQGEHGRSQIPQRFNTEPGTVLYGLELLGRLRRPG